jgi:hypothetical protein
MSTIQTIVFVTIGFMCGYITAIYDSSSKSEQITTQDYYSQSLQYLEDIRNSNDTIIDQAEYYQSLNHK